MLVTLFGMNEPTDGALSLTSFIANDAEVMCAGDADPELRRRFEFPATFAPSLTHSAQVINRWQAERLASTRFPFAIRSAVTRELLGGCELRPLGSGLANVSYWTYPEHRHRGVATRALRLACEVAFTEFRFHTLEVLIDADNVASRKVACANGFEEIGQRDGRLLCVLRAKGPQEQLRDAIG
jgi:RimJ/RimL family protein N-acetyltransferase